MGFHATPSRLSLVFIALSALTASGSASAWNPIFCGPAPIRWLEGYFQTVRNTHSIPPGSPTDVAYDNAIAQMNKAVHVVSKYGDDDPSKHEINFGDGYKQVGLVDRSIIGGQPGATHFIVTCAFLMGWSRWIEEVDIMVANDLPDFSGPSDEAILEQSGQSIFLQQMTRAHGLDYDQGRLNVTGVYRPLPFAGGTGTHVVLFPDDAAGLRAIYPEPARAVLERNLFATPHRLRETYLEIVLNAPTSVMTPFYAGRTGQIFGHTWTVANRGQEFQVIDNAFTLSLLGPPLGYTDPNAVFLGGDTALVVPGHSVLNGDKRFINTHQLAVGEYHLYHRVSVNIPAGGLPEPDVSDNVTHLATKISVVPCP